MKFILLFFLFFSNICAAQETDTAQSNANFLKGSQDGWFWYKDPKELPPKVKKETTPPGGLEKNQPLPKKPLEPFTVEWLRKNMDKLQERAIDNPTKENVSAYMYAQRVAMDKSQNYAEKVQEVVAADPFLDENNRVPIASFAAAQFDRGVTQGKEDALKNIATKGGLWVFYDSKCNFCAPQVNTVKEVSKKYGFSTKFIAMDNNGIKGLLEKGQWIKESGQAKMLNVKLTPTTVFVSPPNNFFVISQGLMSQDGLSERLILSAQTNDMLPPDILAGVQKYQRGLLKPEDLNDGASDDPKTWIEKLKKRLQGRY